MKKTIITFSISILVLVSLALWAINGGFSGKIREILMPGVAVVVVAFALFIGVKRVRSHMRKEPAEDELSRQVMTRAASLSYYISIYLWLFVMYISDRSTLPTHSLIGVGILGMAVIFLLSWIFIKVWGIKNE